MIDLLEATRAWAEIPAYERADLVLGLRAMASQYLASPLKVKQADGRTLHAACDVLTAASVAARKEAQRAQVVAEPSTPTTTYPPSGAPDAVDLVDELASQTMRTLLGEDTTETQADEVLSRGIAGDRCEAGNDCGRLGCGECQQ